MRVDLGEGTEKRHCRLDIHHPAVWRQTAARACALPPTLVIKGHDHIASLVQHPGIVRQIEIFDASIAVAQHNASATLPWLHIVRIVDIANELVLLTVKRHRPLHVSPYVLLVKILVWRSYCGVDAPAYSYHISAENTTEL
jgi:hypothetical protein